MAARRKSHGNIKCEKIYPTLETRKEVSDLKTVAFVLTREQAIDLARKVLDAAQAASTVEVTGFRSRNTITITTPPQRHAPSAS